MQPHLHFRLMKKICKKAVFATKEEAKKRLKEIQNEKSPEHGKKNVHGKILKPKRAYFCPPCNGWHLTSFSMAKFLAVKQKQIRMVAEEWIRKKGWNK